MNDIIQRVAGTGPGENGRRWWTIFGVLVIIGGLAFVLGVSGADPARTWQAFLINFVFWTGLCFGAVLFSAVMTITNARWGRPIKRLAEAHGAFLPVAFVLFWVLLLGKERLFPWILDPVPEKAAWLNAEFMFARDGIGLLLLVVLALALIYHSVRDDMHVLSQQEMGGSETGESGRGGSRVHTVLATLYGLFYALILSLIGYDLVMSLDPHWYSTLFGAYFFMGSFYTGLAALMILTVLAVRNMNMQEFVRPPQLHDLGKLLLGFCLVTGDFFFTQFFVIWYGNLPEEAMYVIVRTRLHPWKLIAWIVLILCFALPFLVLLNRKVKMKHWPMIVLSVVILAGMWLERFLLIAPSLWQGGDLPLGATELLVTGGFFGATGLSVLLFLRRFPVLPVADPLFHEALGSSKWSGER